jgi:transcriptional regulator with PAS, ATPase and Fis domain
VESELFGYERGAHSQAVRGKDGLVSMAEGGTLFLDELTEMPREVQAKLLRFVQERSYYRLGSTTLRKAAVRLLAASNRPLTEEGPFGLRRDLAMRFGPEPFVIVPLRERQGDIATLITHFLRDSSLTVSRPAAELLLRHGWPGNVRELEAVIRRAKHLLEPHERRIEPRHLPHVLRTPSTEKTALAIQSIPSPRRKPRRPAPSREELESLLVIHHGNIAAIARALDRHWRVVYRWVKARRKVAPLENGVGSVSHPVDQGKRGAQVR